MIPRKLGDENFWKWMSKHVLYHNDLHTKTTKMQEITVLKICSIKILFLTAVNELLSSYVLRYENCLGGALMPANSISLYIILKILVFTISAWIKFWVENLWKGIKAMFYILNIEKVKALFNCFKMNCKRKIPLKRFQRRWSFISSITKKLRIAEK